MYLLAQIVPQSRVIEYANHHKLISEIHSYLFFLVICLGCMLSHKLGACILTISFIITVWNLISTWKLNKLIEEENKNIDGICVEILISFTLQVVLSMITIALILNKK